MQLKRTVGTVGTLAHEAVSTAVSVARHPVGSSALAAGFVKGAAGAGLDFVRTTIGGRSPHVTHPPTQRPPEPAPEAPEGREVSQDAPEATATATDDDPRADLPGPDLAEFEPPRPEDLPEPIVIEADDEPANGESGEPFHTEPKAASRASAHGGPAGDREEIEGYAEEIPADLLEPGSAPVGDPRAE